MRRSRRQIDQRRKGKSHGFRRRVSQREPDEQNADDHRTAAVVRPLNMAIHHRIGGPDEDARALSDPMQAEQDQYDADDQQDVTETSSDRKT
jgi:hypothetical protein